MHLQTTMDASTNNYGCIYKQSTNNYGCIYKQLWMHLETIYKQLWMHLETIYKHLQQKLRCMRFPFCVLQRMCAIFVFGLCSCILCKKLTNKPKETLQESLEKRKQGKRKIPRGRLFGWFLARVLQDM